MNDNQWLAERFEEDRRHLRSVAYRLLGSTAEADDAVQEAWIRLNRADTSEVENLSGWLTTVVARVSLDMLRSRRSRREADAEEEQLTPTPSTDRTLDPEREAILADSVGTALLVVLDTLSPAERLAFVLHDLFGMPFEEIAPIVERTPTAARQLASRGRRRVRGAEHAEGATSEEAATQREIVEAFMAAARDGQFEALLKLLDPDVIVRADRAALEMNAQGGSGRPSLAAELRGSEAVARVFSGGARGARLALVDGQLGATWAPGGKPRVVFAFTTDGARITAVSIIADPEEIARLGVSLATS